LVFTLAEAILSAKFLVAFVNNGPGGTTAGFFDSMFKDVISFEHAVKSKAGNTIYNNFFMISFFLNLTKLIISI